MFEDVALLLGGELACAFVGVAVEGDLGAGGDDCLRLGGEGLEAVAWDAPG